jgi:hypothetical protein
MKNGRNGRKAHGSITGLAVGSMSRMGHRNGVSPGVRVDRQDQLLVWAGVARNSASLELARPPRHPCRHLAQFVKKCWSPVAPCGFDVLNQAERWVLAGRGASDPWLVSSARTLVQTSLCLKKALASVLLLSCFANPMMLCT